MSRIRSIHPGLFTDEAFVVLSPMARIFFMGLWTECDDYGVFEWSPLKLKMRLLPADNADAGELLAEIENGRGVMRYELNGRQYGAVRNFCQYQRPKKPTSSYPMTEEVGIWVNTEARSTRDGSPSVGKELPTDGEKDRQMEDGGGNKEKESSSDNSEERKPRKRAVRSPEYEIPDWIPAEPWAAYCAMRIRKRAPVDDYIAAKQFDKLQRWFAAGWDVAKILDKATISGWTDLYEPKPGRDDDMKTSATSSGQPVTAEQYRQTLLMRAETYDRIGRTDEADEIRRELGISGPPPSGMIPINLNDLTQRMRA